MFAELGIGSALGAHKAFINTDEVFVLDDALELLPPQTVVLELDFTAQPSEALLARCRTCGIAAIARLVPLHRAGQPGQRPAAAGRHRQDRCPCRRERTRVAGGAALMRLPLKLLAEKVETREQMEHCKALGFHLFRGYYFAKPTIVSGRQLSASQLGIIRLINLVARDAELPELEKASSANPA